MTLQELVLVTESESVGACGILTDKCYERISSDCEQVQ